MMTKKTAETIQGLSIVFGVVGTFCALLYGFFWIIDPVHQPWTRKGSGAAAAYTKAVGHLYPGVKLYNGTPPDNLTEVGLILSFSNDVPGTTKGRGVLVRRFDGKDVWFDREQLINGEGYWIKKDDPAGRPGLR
jgi:hypothetical protein